MSNLGSNGVMGGERHAELFRKWVNEVEDLPPYLSQGALSTGVARNPLRQGEKLRERVDAQLQAVAADPGSNISKIAEECGLKRNVFYANRTIRYEQMPELEKRLEEGKLLKARASAAFDDAKAVQRLMRAEGG